jgi:hypothetical protein
MKVTTTSWRVIVRQGGLKIRRAKALTPNQLEAQTREWSLRYDLPIIELPEGETFQNQAEDNAVFIELHKEVYDSEAEPVYDEILESGRELGAKYARIAQRSNEPVEDDDRF